MSISKLKKSILMVSIITSSLAAHSADEIIINGSGLTQKNFDCEVEIRVKVDQDGNITKEGTRIFYKTNLYGASFISMDRKDDSLINFQINPLKIHATSYEKVWSWNSIFPLFPTYSKLSGEFKAEEDSNGQVVVRAQWSDSNGKKFNDKCSLQNIDIVE